MLRDKVLSWFKSRFEVVGLLILSAIVYYRWLGFDYFVSSDWPYTSANSLRAFFHIGTWSNLNSFGKVNLNLWRLPIAYMQGVLGGMGFDTRLADKVIFFFPVIILVPLASYYYSFSISKSRIGAVIGSLFFSYNSYFLAIGSQGHIGITIASALLLCALQLLYKWQTDSAHRSLYFDAVGFSLIVSLIGFYDFRFVYIIALILVVQWLVWAVTDRVMAVQTIKFFLGSGSLYILLNLFWLLPFIAASATTSGVVFSRALWRSELFTLSRAFTIHQPFWNPQNFIWHKVGEIPLYLWIPVLVVFYYSIINIKKSKVPVSYLSLCLFGLFLSKQEAEPLSGAYSWLFSHFPGFGAFREASKFYVITIISFTALSSHVVRLLFEKKETTRPMLKWLLVFLIILAPLLNASYVLRGKIDGIYLATKIPESYKSLLGFIDNNRDSYRTLWIPEMGVNWGVFNLKVPAVNYYEVSGTLSDDVPPWLEMVRALDNSKFTGILKILHSQFVRDVLVRAGVRYLVLPKEFIGDTKNPFRIENRGILQQTLEQLDYLREENMDGISPEEVNIYKINGESKPVFTFSSFVKSSSVDERILNFASVLTQSKDFFSFDGKAPDASSTIIERLLTSSTQSTFFKKNGLFVSQVPVLPVSEGGVVSTVVRYKDPKVYHYSIDKIGNIKIKQTNSGKLSISGVSSDDSDAGSDLKTRIPAADEVIGIDGNFYTSSNYKTLNNYITGSGMIDRYKISPIAFNNGDFEKGLWESKVRDCNRIDDKGLLRMGLKRYQYGNRTNFLELAAKSHTACTKTNFEITEGRYLLHILHQSPGADKGSYYLAFDGSSYKMREEIPVRQGAWGSYWKEFVVPAGVTGGEIYLYAKSTENGHEVINRYDDIKIYKVDSVDTWSFADATNSIVPAGTIQADAAKLMYNDKNYLGKQLFSNPSFEDGSWQEKVGDCNNYDTEPNIAMRLNEQEKTEGRYSLELEALRHSACVSTSVSVKPGATYDLSFDYQNPGTSSASYYIGFNDVEKSSIRAQLPTTGGVWKNFSDTIAIPKGATYLSIYIYARETDRKIVNINRYDNFKLVEVPDLRDAFYLVSEPIEKNTEPNSVEYEPISTTKKKVHIKGASTGFFLGMSESYHDQWLLRFDDGGSRNLWNDWLPLGKPNQITNQFHYKLDGFLNAWYVNVDSQCRQGTHCVRNSDGTYDIDMVIEFWPQRWLYLGLGVSGFVFTCCLFYLSYGKIRMQLVRFRSAKVRPVVKDKAL